MHRRLLYEYGLGATLGIAAVAIQATLGQLFAHDSYQLFLGAIALSAIRGGTSNGVTALILSAAAKTAFFFLPSYPGHGQTGVFLDRITMLLLVGAVLCSVGGAVHLSLQRLNRDISRARLLSGLLPICACCKRIRDDRRGWCDLESYISRHSDVTFSHGYCPRCAAIILTEEETIVDRPSGAGSG